MPRETQASQILACVRARNWLRIAAAEWSALREAFPKLSEPALRKALIGTGLPVEQPWRGVDARSLDTLEESLAELANFYQREPTAARKAVIAAKDKARFAARNENAAPEKRALKSEMVDWMLVWLGDPAMFAAWASLRKTQLSPAKPIQP